MIVTGVQRQDQRIALDLTLENRSPRDMNIHCQLQGTFLTDERGNEWRQNVSESRDGLCVKGMELAPRKKAKAILIFPVNDKDPGRILNLHFHETSPRQDTVFAIGDLKLELRPAPETPEGTDAQARERSLTTSRTERMTMKQVLTIAGSDSGGGAGIQADIKSMSANGVYATSVITAITAQNTEEVTDVFELPPSIIAAQIDAIFDDFDVSAVKTGMLSSATIIQVVVGMLKPQTQASLIVDPVMIAKSGRALLKADAVDVLKKELLPLALVVTPNIHEAQQLSGIEIASLADARRAAKVIYQFGCRHVLIKGGHLLAERATDLLYDGRFFNVFRSEFIETPHTHGTGCTFASAIAAHVARGKSVVDAVQAAKTYLTEAIRNSLAIGHGKGPTDHFYFLRKD